MERSGGYGFESRENSLDRRHHRSRYNGRRGSDYQSSRENSMERYGGGGGNWSRNDSSNDIKEEDMSWRRTDESTHKQIAALTKEFKNSVELNNKYDQKKLYDPRNPERPIVVSQSSSRSRDSYNTDNSLDQYSINNNNQSKPDWMRRSSEDYQKFKDPTLLDELGQLDDKLFSILESFKILDMWDDSVKIRRRIEEIFQRFLKDEMKFCQLHRLENYFWKVLFHRTIEWLRNQAQETEDEALKRRYKEKAVETIDYGMKYFESVISLLETRYQYKIDDFIGENAASYARGMGYKSSALVSSQKFFLFLGDLARYREQVNQTNNFGRAKNFYIKAQQVVPQNGQPFNQLALLAVYSVSYRDYLRVEIELIEIVLFFMYIS